MNEFAFYRAQCDQMRKAAAETPLANVRERCERAAAAFETLAEHAARVEATRAKEKQRRLDSALAAGT